MSWSRDWSTGNGAELRQRALNERFPPHARRIRDRPDPIRGEARIVWERDGEEWVPGTAIRWDRDHVLVRLGDRRCSTIGLWLPPQDFRKRDPDQPARVRTRNDQ